MPYKNRHQKIPAELDHRRHVTEEMAENMRSMYRDGESLHAISREFGVHRKTVKRYVVPGYRDEEQGKKQAPHYDRERATEYTRRHRQRKRMLELEGKLQ